MNELSRHRPQICPAVALNLRNVIRSSHRELEVLTAQRTGDALCDTGFTGAGRTYKAEYFSRDVTLEFANGDEFENTIFDILESE